MKNLYFTNLRYHATYIKVTYIKVSNNILMYLFEMVKEHLFDIFLFWGRLGRGRGCGLNKMPFCMIFVRF